MKEYGIIIGCLVALMLVAVGVLVWLNLPDPAKPVEAITIRTQAVKQTYARGEPIDLTGLVIFVVYEDGSTGEFTGIRHGNNDFQVIGGTNVNLSPEQQSVPTTITITFRGKSTSYTIQVGHAIVASTRIDANPTITQYSRSAPLNFAGFKLELIFTDHALGGRPREVIDHTDPRLTFSHATASTMGGNMTIRVTFTYTYTNFVTDTEVTNYFDNNTFNVIVI